MQHTEWVNPFVLVSNNSSTLHVFGDYRSTANGAAKKASYLLRTTGEVFANLCGGTLFSTLHLYQSYQLKGDDETAALFTVNSTKGLFKMKCLSFGIPTTTAIFPHKLETMLAGIPGAIVYPANIIVTGKGTNEHVVFESGCVEAKRERPAPQERQVLLLNHVCRVSVKPK